MNLQYSTLTLLLLLSTHKQYNKLKINGGVLSDCITGFHLIVSSWASFHLTHSYFRQIWDELGVSKGLIVSHVGIDTSCIHQEGLNTTHRQRKKISFSVWQNSCERGSRQQKAGWLRTWYSSAVNPAAVATCSSCVGVCFLKILCSKTKMFADSGEVCSSTAKPPYLRRHIFYLVWNVSNFQQTKIFILSSGDFTVVIFIYHSFLGVNSDLPSGTWHVVGVHLLLRGKQTEGLGAVKCRDPDVIWEVVLGVHHL